MGGNTIPQAYEHSDGIRYITKSSQRTTRKIPGNAQCGTSMKSNHHDGTRSFVSCCGGEYWNDEYGTTLD